MQVPEIVGSAFFKEVTSTSETGIYFDTPGLCQCIKNILPSLKIGDVVDFSFKVKENHQDYKSYNLSVTLDEDETVRFIDNISNTAVKFSTKHNEIFIKRTSSAFESLIPLSLSINGTKIILTPEE